MTLGRLKTAIKQASFGPEYYDRALELYEIVSDTINELACQNPEVHEVLTYDPRENELTLPELARDHVLADVQDQLVSEEEEEEEGDFYPAWEDPESYGLYHGGQLMQDPEDVLPDYDREEEVL